MKRTPVFYTWPVIIIFLILFFPIGFYLIYKRFTYDKMTATKNVKGLTVSGWIVVGIALLFFIAGFSGGMYHADGSPAYDTALGLLVMFAPVGVFFLVTAAKIKTMYEKHKNYSKVVINQENYILENIASAVGAPYEQAVSDLRALLKAGYFEGAYLNEKNHEFILTTKSPIVAQNKNMEGRTKSVKCFNCGANSTVFMDKDGVCDYCGSPIKL